MKTVKLGDICDFKSNSPTKPLPYVGMEDIEGHSGRFLGSLEPRSAKSTTSYFDETCVLYGKLRPYLNKVFVPDFEGHCSTEFITLRPNLKLIDRKYLWRWLTSPKTLSTLSSNTTGTRMPRANLKVMKDLEIEIPSLEDQQRIVARLDAAFEKISAAEVLTRQNLDNVSALQKSILDKYLSASDSTHRLGDVITLQRGYDLPKRIRTHGEYPLASSSGIIDTHNEFKATGSGVFIGRSGSVGNVFYVEENFWPLNTTLYVKDFHGNNPKYCYWLLKNTDLKQFAGGTGVPTLNRNIVHEHMVIVAEKDDQPAIAQNIDVALGKTRKLESQYQKKLAKLTDLRQSLLAEAFITTSAV